MADLKTRIRELSVATTIGLLKNDIDFTVFDLYDSRKFFQYASNVVDNFTANDFECFVGSFSNDIKQIISNGYNLGLAIYNNKNFNISQEDKIEWLGNDTQKTDPVDITVGDYSFSLKEDSFILENMGLYKLLNCFTGSTYKTRHIFSDYAREEYEIWFGVAWEELIRLLIANNGFWELTNNVKHKKSTILLCDEVVVLNYYINNKIEANAVLPIDCSLSVYETKTNAKIREHVFAKFINNELDRNEHYNNAKKACAIAASESLARELNDNLNYDAGIARFLRIHNFEYYYAKTTIHGIKIYKVPSMDDFKNEIIIEKIEASVPNKQANILTTIKNTNTNKSLVLRNECRFSHGQFNGTPEAKMYYESGGSLLVIYDAI